MPTATTEQLIAGLYTAFFDRAPEAAGLNYWRGEFAAGADVRTLASGFAGHAVFAATYDGMNDQQFVEAIYQNVLGAAGDAEGIGYWVNQLADVGIPRHQMVADFVHSALTIDLDAMLGAGELSSAEYDLAVNRQDTLTNKTDIGVMFAQQLGSTTNLSPATDENSKASLEADLSYRSAQAIIASVNAETGSMAQPGNLILSAAEYLNDLNTSNVGLVAMDSRASSYGGRDGAADIYLFNSNNFSSGDTVRLTNFELLDQLILGEQYGHRNTAPALGDDTLLEVFVEQHGDNVHMSVERDVGGNQLVVIEIVGVTVDEIVPAGNFLP